MFMGLGMPIPDLSNKPGPGRPGYPTGGAFEFKLEIQGPATFSFNASKSAGGTNFSIDWGDTTVVSGLTGTSHTHTYGSGTFVLAINSKDDSGPIDTFQITGSQTNKNAAKKILNWGTNPWVSLNAGFQNCQGLTNIDKSDFFSASAINLTSAFQNCDNLTTVDFTGWKASGNVTGANMFRDCTALESFKLKGSISFASGSSNNYWFRDSGASTGCTFDISNLNFSGSTGNQANVQGWFYGSNIKIDSKLINWTFPSASWSLKEFFRTATIIGSNATVDLSNWTLPSNSSTVLEAMFREFSTIAAAGGTEQVLNMSNWNFGSAGNLKALFHTSGIRRITGLSTWSSSGLTNIQNLFYNTFNLSIDANDNFTSSFWNNSNISLGSLAFYQLGSSTTSSTAGAFPNLNGATFSSINFNSMFLNAHFNTDVSLTGVNFPSANNINFYSAFQGVELFHSNSTIDLSNTVVNALTVERAFRFAKVDNIIFGNDFDFTNCTGFAFSFRSTLDSTVTYPMPNVTFPIDSNRPNYSSATDTRSYPAIDFSTCQADNLIRALHDTGGNASGNASTFDLKDSQVTGAPSIVNSYLDNVLPSRGWTMTANSTDAALPFAYAAYALDPSVYPTGISPTTVPSGATFSTTTNGVTVNPTTGAISYASTFRGGINLKCTYSDGCYNEVQFIVQVPFVMRTVIPGLVGSTTYLDMQIKPQMSAGECFVDWGDNNSQTLTGNTIHTYASAGTYDIKIFDSPSGSKFENFSGYFPVYTGLNGATYGSTYDIDIIQWGEIQWKNPSQSGRGWFSINQNQKSYIELAAASDDGPDLSQVTSLKQMFGTGGGGAGQSDIARFTDPNDSMRSWNTSTITDMSRMWAAKLTDSSLSLDLSQWDVSKVETFASMFDSGSGNQQSSIGDLDISGWNTESATNMGRMFYRTSANSVTGLGDLNTSSVTSMSQMFDNAGGGVINQANETFATKMVNGVLRWDVNNVVSFSNMFNDANALSDTTFPTNWNISSDPSKTVSMTKMFAGTPTGLTGVTNLDALATKTINETWYGGTSYTAWNMSRVNSLSQFAYASGGGPVSRNYNIASWQISSALTNMYYMFGGKSGGNGSVWQQDVGHWDVSGLDDGPNKVSYWLSARNGQNPPNMATSIYDSILDGWGSQAGTAGFPTNISWQNGNSKYTAGGAAEAGRTALINAGWTITDGGAIYSNTNSLSFNGSSEYVNTSFAAIGNTAMTFSAYVYLDSAWAARGTVIGSGFANSSQFSLTINSSRKLELFIRNGGANPGYLTANTALALGQWHHVAVTVSNNGTNNDCTFYLNGSVDNVTGSTQAYGTGQNFSATNATPYYIGANNVYTGSVGVYFKGKIDEVMIWDNVISTGNIQAYANVIGSGSIPDPNAITGLQLWNRMGD